MDMTDTKARRRARPRPEQHHPNQPRPGQPRPDLGPERTWHDHRDLPIAGTQPQRSSSAGDVVLAYLRLQVHALKSLEPMVRADEFDAVHQMRVATRRLRAAFRSFGQVIPCSDSERLAGELSACKRLRARLGSGLPAPATVSG